MYIWYASLFPSVCMAELKCAALDEMWTALHAAVHGCGSRPCDTLLILQLWERLESSPPREKRGNIGLDGKTSKSCLVILRKKKKKKKI